MADVIQFEVGVNLAGIGPVDVMQQDPPGGPAEVEILDVRQVTKEGEGGGKTTLRFSVALLDGPGKGITTGLVIGTDWTKPFNVGHLKNLLLGMHNPQGVHSNPEKLNGVVTLKPDIFKGARAYIFTKVPPEGEIDESTGRAKRADKNFITQGMFQAAKAAAALNGGVSPAVPSRPAQPAVPQVQSPAAQHAPTSTPTPAVTNGAAAGAGLGDLFAS